MRAFLKAITFASALALSSIAGAAGLDGFDPVSYFNSPKPLKGSDSITAQHQGETYHFASAQSRDQFVANPERFLPQYGGHCAWAIAQGKLAPGNASVYKVVEGKLYLNVNQSVASRWEQDIPGFIRGADERWPSLKK
jgi:YHS domain-containing protein